MAANRSCPEPTEPAPGCLLFRSLAQLERAKLLRSAEEVKKRQARVFQHLTGTGERPQALGWVWAFLTSDGRGKQHGLRWSNTWFVMELSLWRFTKWLLVSVRWSFAQNDVGVAHATRLRNGTNSDGFGHPRLYRLAENQGLESAFLARTYFYPLQFGDVKDVRPKGFHPTTHIEHAGG